jgi:thiol-disulfide isomerase/thioredoxin
MASGNFTQTAHAVKSVSLPMKTFFLILFTFITFAAMAQETAPVLTGKIDAAVLTNKATCTWYQPTFESYQPDAATVANLKKAIPGDATFLVFGGMWCSDTHNLLPKFYKTMAEAGVAKERIQLYMVDEQKNSPEKTEKQYAVINVPTFIFMQNNQEKGRIVENVQQSIEADLLKLVQQ